MAETKYIGIDLAWTNKNATGICVLDGRNAVLLEAAAYTDGDILEIISKNTPCTVSVDAPLKVDNETGGRSVDGRLMRTPVNGRHLKLYATSRTYMTKHFGGIRGEAIREALELQGFRTGINLIETFPTGIYLSLYPELFASKYKLSSGLPLSRLKANAEILLRALKRSGFGFELSAKETSTKKEYKNFEDRLDALLCAANSFHLYHGTCRIWSDDSGTIALPSAEN